MTYNLSVGLKVLVLVLCQLLAIESVLIFVLLLRSFNVSFLKAPLPSVHIIIVLLIEDGYLIL